MPMGNVLYRLLRQDEDPDDAIKAKNPNARYQVVQHVNGTINSQYISTTASLETAEMFVGLAKEYNKTKNIRQSKYIIVRIDVKKMKKEKPGNTIIDLSDPKILDREIPPNKENPNRGRKANARKWATKYQEVLIIGVIPASCIEEVKYDPSDPSTSEYDPSDYSEADTDELSDSMSFLKVSKRK